MSILGFLFLSGLAAILAAGIVFWLLVTVEIVKRFINKVKGKVVVGSGKELKRDLEKLVNDPNSNVLSEGDFDRIINGNFVAGLDSEGNVDSIEFADDLDDPIRKLTNRAKNGVLIVETN